MAVNKEDVKVGVYLRMPDNKIWLVGLIFNDAIVGGWASSPIKIADPNGQPIKLGLGSTIVFGGTNFPKKYIVRLGLINPDNEEDVHCFSWMAAAHQYGWGDVNAMFASQEVWLVPSLPKKHKSKS